MAVSKTFNCKRCGCMYWAFLPAELDAHNRLQEKDREAFEKKVFDQHKKTCFAGGEPVSDKHRDGYVEV